jgi:hypothetical protein
MVRSSTLRLLRRGSIEASLAVGDPDRETITPRLSRRGSVEELWP